MEASLTPCPSLGLGGALGGMQIKQLTRSVAPRVSEVKNGKCGNYY
jgi:hypothetical protein